MKYISDNNERCCEGTRNTDQEDQLQIPRVGKPVHKIIRYLERQRCKARDTIDNLSEEEVEEVGETTEQDTESG